MVFTVVFKPQPVIQVVVRCGDVVERCVEAVERGIKRRYVTGLQVLGHGNAGVYVTDFGCGRCG